MLIAAASTGDLALLRHMSLVFASARSEEYHEQALLAAVLADRVDVVRVLLGSGVDPKALEGQCIQVAHMRGCTAVLSALTDAIA
jgi:hypothetical protein